MITDFLHGIQQKFNASTYDLMSNNCNNFSNELCEFLVGRGIPVRIAILSLEVEWKFCLHILKWLQFAFNVDVQSPASHRQLHIMLYMHCVTVCYAGSMHVRVVCCSAYNNECLY
jgi:hypothetical protein